MSSGDADRDVVLRDLRAQIAANDLALLQAANLRLELVRRLKEHKDLHGIEFVVRPIAAARTWLLTRGWRRHGLLRAAEAAAVG